MCDRDANQDAMRQVEKAADSELVEGRDPLESDALRRQLDEAKQSLSVPANPPSEKPV